MEVKIYNGKKTVKISKQQAEALIQLQVGGFNLIPNFYVMCQGWSEDDEYQEIDNDMLNEDGTLDDDYYNFELWER
jgi:hypothetical protein